MSDNDIAVVFAGFICVFALGVIIGQIVQCFSKKKGYGLPETKCKTPMPKMKPPKVFDGKFNASLLHSEPLIFKDSRPTCKEASERLYKFKPIPVVIKCNCDICKNIRKSLDTRN